VVSIGARCTQIITFDNLDLLIPNSYLLQNTITNLTLTDGGIVKTRVNIPVSCRSNPDNVIKLILHILQKHPNILQYPDPEVNIKEINDNQIIYEASFFADLFGKIPRRKIITEVYSEVFKLFFQNNVEVLKPQAFINWE
jgi:potassium efflux system protein